MHKSFPYSFTLEKSDESCCIIQKKNISNYLNDNQITKLDSSCECIVLNKWEQSLLANNGIRINTNIYVVIQVRNYHYQIY